MSNLQTHHIMDVLPREVTTVGKAEMEAFRQGRRVGCYLLGNTLGEGSFAKVKEAIHAITGERVAVKIIDKKRAREDRYISKNLRREARILQLVRHPNIIQLFEVLETDHYYYLIMEFCAGGELLDYICSKKKLDEVTAKKLVAQLVSAVEGMHQSGVVHRDLKIENFLLTEDEDLKIVDFGLSNILSSSCMEKFNKTGIFPQLLNTHCGSPAYAAPELLAQKQYGPQVDVWSIGINMYAMLTGFLPYMMEPFNVMEMYEKMMQRKMTPVPSFLSKECRDLLMRLLEPVPEWRISLKVVMKHKWFAGTNSIPLSISLGDMMYNKKELCEGVLGYMKHDLKIKTKDTINAVISNRAVHASAVYHLLVRRLDRYLKAKKLIDNTSKKGFSTVEVIKKANLSTENFASPVVNKTKKFSFHGRKIENNSSQGNIEINNNKAPYEQNSDDHQTLYETKTHVENYGDIKNEINTFVTKQQQKMEELNNEANIENNKKDCSESNIQNKPKKKRHKRSASSTDGSVIHEAIRNSITCDPKVDFSKPPHDELMSPKDPFLDNSIIATRKASYDGFLDDDSDNLSSRYTNPEIKKCSSDVSDISPENTLIRSSNSAQNSKRPLEPSNSINIEDNINIKEHKEACPGWSITKIVKQRPLKPEYNIRGDLSRTSTPPPSLAQEVPYNEEKLNVTSIPSIRNACKKVPMRVLRNIDLDKLADSPEKIETIQRPETPQKVRTASLTETSDINQNYEIQNLNSVSLSDKIRILTGSISIEDVKPQNERRKSRTSTANVTPTPPNITRNTPEIKDILSNNKHVNKLHVMDIDRLLLTPEADAPWRVPDKDTMRNIHANQKSKLVCTVESDESSRNSTPVAMVPTTNTLPKTEIANHLPRVRSLPIKGLVKARMAKLESFETDNKTEKQAIPIINKISPSKKTLQLNFKQFAQFKVEKRNRAEMFNTSPTRTSMALKPLEINFNFKLRKKKPYTKQQTKSLTDITKIEEETKPSNEQILTPKTKYIEDTDVYKDLKQESPKMEADKNTSSTFKTTVKIVSLGRNNKKGNNKTEIFISAHQNKKKEAPKKELFTVDKIKQSRLNSKQTSFDSGFFNNSTDDEINNTASPHITTPLPQHKTASRVYNPKISNGSVDTTPMSREKTAAPDVLGCVAKEKNVSNPSKQKLHEVQSAKYRCQPVHKAEITTTAPVHNHDSTHLRMIREEIGDNNRCHGYQPLARRCGSLNSTQERVGFVSRSVDVKQYYEALKANYNLKKQQNAGNQNLTKPVVEKPAIQKMRRTKSLTMKQYPIERTIIGSASPKLHRRPSLGRTAVSEPTTPTCSSPTVFDVELERDKAVAFTHALETAAWRKRSLDFTKY